MLSTNAFKSFAYSFAALKKTPYKPFLRRYFKKSEENLYKAKQQLEKHLDIPPISQNLFLTLFRQKPLLFVDESKQSKHLQSRIVFLKDLATKYELAKIMQNVMYKNRYILFKAMSNQSLQNLCKTVHENYGFTNEQINTIFSNYYRTINPKLPQMLDQKIQVFNDYLQLNKQQSVQLFAKHPFLIPASTSRIKQTFSLLLAQSKSQPLTLNKQKIIKLLNDFPETFLLGRHQIKDLIAVFASWGPSQEEIWKIILESPVLLNNFPYEVMPLKRKLFRYFNFTTEMGRLILTKYPLVLMSSISSLEAKLIFIKERLKLPINEQTLELLQYKFSQIRPRGQLLVRAKHEYTTQSFVQNYLRISDQQFAKKLQIPLSRLVQEKQRFKQTQELDFRRKIVLKGSNVEKKIKGIVSDMREELKAVSSASV